MIFRAYLRSLDSHLVISSLRVLSAEYQQRNDDCYSHAILHKHFKSVLNCRTLEESDELNEVQMNQTHKVLVMRTFVI